MPPRSTRRSYLLLACSAAASLAGCSTDGSSEQLAHEVELFNELDGSQALTVRVESDTDEMLYRRQFHLAPDTWEEKTEPFTGSPATISVTFDTGETREYEWPTPDCDEGVRSAGGATLFLTEPTAIRIEPTCNTVYATTER
jgi:hypothetical protein